MQVLASVIVKSHYRQRLAAIRHQSASGSRPCGDRDSDCIPRPLGGMTVAQSIKRTVKMKDLYNTGQV